MKGIVYSDVGVGADPYLFGAGFLAVATGLMLSQVHREEGIFLTPGPGVAFNISRKVSAVGLLAYVVLGFWVVGLWWLALAPVLAALAGIPVNILKNSQARLRATFGLMFVGLVTLMWASGPTLISLGVLPRL